MVSDAGAQFVGTDVPLEERLGFIRESFERQVPPERQTLEIPDGQRAQYEEELAFAREQGRKLGGDPMPAIRVKRKWTAKLEAQQARQQQNHDWLYGDNNTNESDDPWSSIVGEDYTDDDDGLMD
jgi:hypothetical protein